MTSLLLLLLLLLLLPITNGLIHGMSSITSRINRINRINSINSIDNGITYGADNFGDLMGGCETNVVVYGSFTPFERIIITANGNLQRIMSAYYGAPVTVNIIKSNPISDISLYKPKRHLNSNTTTTNSDTTTTTSNNDTTNNDDNTNNDDTTSSSSSSNKLLCVYDREVNLLMNNQIFCTAKSIIEIYDAELINAIEYKKIGIGQMFRYLGALPSFKLHAVGRKEDGSLWRDYSLFINGRIYCHFIEEFTNDIFNLVT